MIWDYGKIEKPTRWPSIPTDAFGQEHWTHMDRVPKALRPFVERVGAGTDYMRLGTSLDLRHHRTYTFSAPLTFGEGMATPVGTDVSLWHKDASHWFYIAVWSTDAPTEIMAMSPSDGKPSEVFIPKNRHLIVIDNRRCFHRVGRNPRWNRSFLRIGFSGTWWKPLDMYRVL